MANWWKCKVVHPCLMIPYSKGEVLFAKNGDDFITLYDGRQESQVPKLGLKYLKLISRLPDSESDLIQKNYEQKKAAQATWDIPMLPE